MNYVIIRFFVVSFIVFFSSEYVRACSIVGYIGNKQCQKIIMTGLERLEYRGYDSAGFACIESNNKLSVIKAEGQLVKLKNQLALMSCNGTIGIGHTRWATHGAATTVNAHPHTDCKEHIAVVHNGIIENFSELKSDLISCGHVFRSATDTEVIAHLFERAMTIHHAPEKIMSDVARQLEGSYGCVCISQLYPDMLFVMRKGSPICIGVGEGEFFIGSDVLAFAGRTNNVIFMPDESCAIVRRDSVTVYNAMGHEIPKVIKHVDLAPEAYEKLGHEHFMLKEIYEQKMAIQRSINYFQSLGASVWKKLGITQDDARQVQKIVLLGCGTSWHAARIGQFFFESVCKIPAHVMLASEFRYMPFFPEDNTLYIAVSQSGETADTLEAIRLLSHYNIPVITISNVASSTMVRETQGALITQAGPEIAVASTKAFSTQITALYWLANLIGLQKNLISDQDFTQAIRNIMEVSEVLESNIEKYKLDIMQTLAKKYAQSKRFMFLGRLIGYPFAMEAALKLKEISYIFAQGYPAGELKHGSIALIDVETPVVLFSHLDPIMYQKLVANAQEVKARKGHLIVFAFEGQQELISIADQVFELPRVADLLEPLAMTGLMQFFVYEIAKTLGCDIDKPRNLAKAVTVE